MSKSFDELVKIMDRLLSPDGCPWDLKQTHQTLIPYLIEESYEVVDAIERNCLPDLQEELGDLLLQVVFHAALQSKQGGFSIDEVANGISEKLIRRHPHVFGSAECLTEDDVANQWEDIKAEEKKSKSENLLDSIPKALPALAEAQKLSKKAAKVGFDWTESVQILDKVSEEIGELPEALESKNAAHIEEEIGDLLFTLVNWCRHHKIDPEMALKRTNNKFRNRFGAMQSFIAQEHQQMKDLSLNQWDQYWNRAKEKLK